MTDTQLREIADRLDATGFGPWQLFRSPASHHNQCIQQEHWTLLYADEEEPENNEHIACFVSNEEVAAFLQHSRTDVFYLFKYVQHLQQLVKDAYIEGYNDALLRDAGKIPHILPYSWPYSKAKGRLHGEPDHPKNDKEH
jgi:hypothetical protein